MSDAVGLNELLAHGAIAPVDYEFARALGTIEGEGSEDLQLCAALTSQWLQRGHVCFDLSEFSGHELWGDAPGDPPAFAMPLPDALDAFRSVGAPGDFVPLTRVGTRLYLTRYWQYEHAVARAIRERMGSEGLPPGLDEAGVVSRFGTENISPSQARAVCAALTHRFCILTGGPGTGKTSTVVKLLCALLEQDPGTRFAVCAPTGKAAARLEESLGTQVGSLDCDESVRERLLDPDHRAATLHRLLGSRPNSPYFRHNRENPLPHDVVVVDEASMVDVAMMAKLVDALREDARLVLVGDKDQLSSVEAGSVLGDLCSGAAGDDDPLSETICVLRENFRSQDAPGIIAFASRFAQPMPATLEDLAGFKADAYTDVLWSEPGGNNADWETTFDDIVREAWQGLAHASSGEDAFGILRNLQVLAAVRSGPRGVDTLNGLARKALHQSSTHLWYHGRPIMITQNDYNVGLYNGDIGIAFREDGRYFVWFEQPDGELRSVAVNRLPPHESAYAITIHKSQGTEAERVLMILPDRESPVLTRELVYTGATRARRRLDVWAPDDVLHVAASRRTKRMSGLSAQLWGDHGA